MCKYLSFEISLQFSSSTRKGNISFHLLQMIFKNYFINVAENLSIEYQQMIILYILACLLTHRISQHVVNLCEILAEWALYTPVWPAPCSLQQSQSKYYIASSMKGRDTLRGDSPWFFKDIIFFPLCVYIRKPQNYSNFVHEYLRSIETRSSKNIIYNVCMKDWLSTASSRQLHCEI